MEAAVSPKNGFAYFDTNCFSFSLSSFRPAFARYSSAVRATPVKIL